MQESVYKTKGVCSTKIRFTVDKGILTRVRFEKGCAGNLQAISRLVEGRPVAEVIEQLRGIPCEDKSTSCPDQLARALEEMQAANG